MMGFNTPGDQRVPVTVRDWNALKLALWRSKVAWEITAREASVVLARCRHDRDCPGAKVETEPCLQLPDREIRMSALVMLGAARQFMPTVAVRPANAPYYAPSREYFSEVLAELAAAQVELEVLRSKDMSVQAVAEELLRTTLPSPPPTVNRLADFYPEPDLDDEDVESEEAS